MSAIVMLQALKYTLARPSLRLFVPTVNKSDLSDPFQVFTDPPGVDVTGERVQIDELVSWVPKPQLARFVDTKFEDHEIRGGVNLSPVVRADCRQKEWLKGAFEDRFSCDRRIARNILDIFHKEVARSVAFLMVGFQNQLPCDRVNLMTRRVNEVNLRLPERLVKDHDLYFRGEPPEKRPCHCVRLGLFGTHDERMRRFCCFSVGETRY